MRVVRERFPDMLSDEEIANKNLVVLDAACGGGKTVRELKLRGMNIVGADAYLDLGQLKERDTFVQTNLLQTPFPDDKFDIIFTNNGPLASIYIGQSLEAETVRLLREMHRILKPGGTLRIGWTHLKELEPAIKQVPGFRVVKRVPKFEVPAGQISNMQDYILEKIPSSESSQ